MNFMEETEKLKAEGYSEANAQARLCQDIILQGISQSSLSRNVTIKGGVVMRSLSRDARRATQDVDIDFIRYSLEDDSIERFIKKINNIPGITISTTGIIEELKHQDYKGKRVHILVVDDHGNHISSKVDIGVHKDLDLLQTEYCFDICFLDECACLLMNSPAQMIIEKIKSLLRFGTGSTRYKDIFDIYYLKDMADYSVLCDCMRKYIYSDETLSISTAQDISNRLTAIFDNKRFRSRVIQSRKNWLDQEYEDVTTSIIRFFKDIT